MAASLVVRVARSLAELLESVGDEPWDVVLIAGHDSLLGSAVITAICTSEPAAAVISHIVPLTSRVWFDPDCEPYEDGLARLAINYQSLLHVLNLLEVDLDALTDWEQDIIAHHVDKPAARGVYLTPAEMAEVMAEVMFA